MFGHYKFLHTEDVHHWTGGRLRLSSLAWFRHLETLEGPWIGDSLEGTARYEGTIETSPKNFDFLNKLGIHDQSGGNRVTDLTVRYPPCFVFCFSTGLFANLRTALCESPEPQYRYDAAIRIINAHRLLTRIFDMGKVLELDGQPVKTLFHNPQLEGVSYLDRTASFHLERHIPVSPFVKAPHFRDQREARIVLHPNDRSMSDRVTIEIPIANGVFEIVETNMQIGRKIRPPLPTSDLTTALNSIAEEIDDWWLVNHVEEIDSSVHLSVLRGEIADPDGAIARASQKNWSERSDALAAVMRRCANEFGSRVSILYWKARMAGMTRQNGMDFFREFEEPRLLNETSGSQLRNLATAVQRRSNS